MLPKGYKIVVNWFQEVAEDPDYANPEMRNETRDMNNNIIESDSDEEVGPRKGWKSEDYEEWVALDERKSGVLLEKIKDEPREERKEAATQTRQTGNDDSKTEKVKENTPVTVANQEKASARLGEASRFAAGFKDILAKVATPGVDAVKYTLPVRMHGVEEKTGEMLIDKAVKSDIKEVDRDAHDADTETVS
jgi:hypothetical protein